MKISYLVILLSLITLNVLSQKNSYVIKGTVKNVHNEPIENANIFSSTNIGTISNNKGEFELSVSSSDKVIYASHVAYKEKIVNIEQNSIVNGVLSIQIVLKETQYQLDAVDITADKNWQVIRPERVWIYDYVVHEKNLLLLLHDSTKYELRYLDEDDNTLFQYTLNRKKVNRFIEDGLGNIHIGMNDSVFQIYLESNKIQFYDGVTQDKYNEIMKPIAAETDSLFLTKKQLLNNQRIVYSGTNKNTKSVIPIADIFNKENYKYAVQAKQQRNKHYGINIMGDICTTQLAWYREFYQWGNFFEEVASYPIYCPLIKTHDGFCIFNTVDKKIDHYSNSGHFLKSINSDFDSKKRILHIEIDKYTNKIYSIWKKQGRIKMDEIDIQSGNIVKNYPLKNYINIEKIKICNGKVYFLHTNKNSSKKLVRIPLEQL
jgi:hypothetical protein